MKDRIQEPQTLKSQRRRTVKYFLWQFVGWGTFNANNIIIFSVWQPYKNTSWGQFALVFGPVTFVAIAVTHAYGPIFIDKDGFVCRFGSSFPERFTRASLPAWSSSQPLRVFGMGCSGL